MLRSISTTAARTTSLPLLPTFSSQGQARQHLHHFHVSKSSMCFSNHAHCRGARRSLRRLRDAGLDFLLLPPFVCVGGLRQTGSALAMRMTILLCSSSASIGPSGDTRTDWEQPPAYACRRASSRGTGSPGVLAQRCKIRDIAPVQNSASCRA